PQFMVLFLPDRRVTITHRGGQEKLVRRGRGWEGDLSTELVLELEHRSAVPLRANGAKATFSFARGGRWIACGDTVSLDVENRGSCRIRAAAAGHVPRIASAPLKGPVEFTDGP